MGIWSSKLFDRAGLLLVWTVGWSEIVDKKLSSFVLNGITDFVSGRTVFRTSQGRRLNSLAPLTARLASLARLTRIGAFLFVDLTIHSFPLLGFILKLSV